MPIRASARLDLQWAPSFPDVGHMSDGSDEGRPLLKKKAIDRWVPSMGLGALGAGDGAAFGSEDGDGTAVQVQLGKPAAGDDRLKKGPGSEGGGSEGGGSEGGYSAGGASTTLTDEICVGSPYVAIGCILLVTALLCAVSVAVVPPAELHGGDTIPAPCPSSPGNQGASSAGGSEADKGEDLTADFRRAKRLKKLKHLLASTQAQTAAKRFAWHTYAVVAVMLGVHIACFAAFSGQLKAQHM